MAAAKNAIERCELKIDQLEKSMVQNFHDCDMPLLQKAFADIQLGTREQFADHPFWKLFWSGDYFASDLESRIGNQMLLKAEYQVSILISIMLIMC